MLKGLNIGIKRGLKVEILRGANDAPLDDSVLMSWDVGWNVAS